LSPVKHPSLKAFSAIAVTAGPRLGPIEVPAVMAIMRVLNLDQLEIFFPIRALLGQWAGTETDLDPAHRAVFDQTRLGHVIQILVSGNGTCAQCFHLNSLEQGRGLVGFDSGGD